MRIGTLARMVEKSKATLRYYEEIGLLEPPPRSASGYRQYSSDAVERVRFVIHAQQQGFTLSEIREVLHHCDDGASPCAEVVQLARHKISEIEQEIAQLKKRRKKLRRALSRWESDSLGETSFCPILNTSDSSTKEVKNHGTKR